VLPVVLTFLVVAVLLAGEVLIPANRAATIERLALAVCRRRAGSCGG